MPADAPNARRLDLVEHLHGHQVADPYRWLEDAAAPEAVAWSAAQDVLCRSVLDQLAGREGLDARLRELLDAGAVGPPAVRHQRVFWLRRDPGQQHAVLRVADLDADQATARSSLGADDGPGGRALIDLDVIDPTGRTTLDAWSPSPDGRLLAYQLSEGGDEESALRVLDVTTGEVVDGPIDRCRYASVAWLANSGGFYYSRRLAPGQVPAGEEQYHRRVRLHTLGEDPDDDAEIFGAGRDLRTYYGAHVSPDGRWLVLSASVGTEPRDDVWLADLAASSPERPELVALQEGVDARLAAWVAHDGRLYRWTDAGAPRGRLLVGDPMHPDRTEVLVPEDPEAVLGGLAVLDQVLVVTRSRHAISEAELLDRETGGLVARVALPGLGTVSGPTAAPGGGSTAYLGYTDHVTPSTVLWVDAAGTGGTWARPPGTAAPRVQATQETVTSADGTTVRLTVVRRSAPGNDAEPRDAEPRDAEPRDAEPRDADLRDAELRDADLRDAEPRDTASVGRVAAEAGRQAAAAAAAGIAAHGRPTVLYGYGGFGIALEPAYSAATLAWVEAGGVWATAHLRGGAEEGEDWHRAGMREHKQNVFDDLAACAEHLVASGTTGVGQLAIMGGSNGGLLVGAALTQRPELYRAVVCSAPLLDMVRYEQFGLGSSWNDEYGRAEDPEELGWLLGYSPYHAVADGTDYPAVLFTVFDRDTRVDPLHARKMCAALQYATTSGRPVLLRREADVGHGARSVARAAALAVDQLSFLAAQTGLALPGPG